MCDCLFALQKKAKEFGKQKSLENVDAKAYIESVIFRYKKKNIISVKRI